MAQTTIDVGAAPSPFTTEICVVSKDPAGSGNMISWEVPEDYFYSGFRIFREYEISDQFVPVGNDVGYQESYFIDTEVNADASSYRYKIAMVGYCDLELSDLSAPHKTFHLMANRGVNGVVNLLWDNYEGFAYSKIRILRGSALDNMNVIDEIPSNLTSYTDISPVTEEIYYQLEIEGEGDCGTVISNGRTTSAQRISRSNVVNKENAITGLDDSAIQDSDIEIYPVPASDYVNVEIKGSFEGRIRDLFVMDISGKLINEYHGMRTKKYTLRTHLLGSGLYYLQVHTENGDIINKKLIVN
jgi:hypothetical protein